MAIWRTSCLKTLLTKKGTENITSFHLNSCSNTKRPDGGIIVHFDALVFFSCLMRLVDDFLLITPDLNDAQMFLKYDTLICMCDIIIICI